MRFVLTHLIQSATNRVVLLRRLKQLLNGALFVLKTVNLSINLFICTFSDRPLTVHEVYTDTSDSEEYNESEEYNKLDSSALASEAAVKRCIDCSWNCAAVNRYIFNFQQSTSNRTRFQRTKHHFAVWFSNVHSKVYRNFTLIFKHCFSFLWHRAVSLHEMLYKPPERSLSSSLAALKWCITFLKQSLFY